MKRGLIIDMDGVLYSGDTLITGADQFVQKLKSCQIPFMLVTNNSANTAEQYAKKLLGLGIEVAPRQIITATEAAIEHIKTCWPNGRVFVVGEESIKGRVEESRLRLVATEQPDCVLIGEVRTLDYLDLCLATRFVINGASLLATNIDSVIPTVDGPIVGCGSITRCIENASGKQAVYLGKPLPLLCHLAAERLGLPISNLVVIGDNLDTDIGLAFNLGVPSVLVLSGLTREADLETCSRVPSRVVNSVVDLLREPWFKQMALIVS